MNNEDTDSFVAFALQSLTQTQMPSTVELRVANNKQRFLMAFRHTGGIVQTSLKIANVSLSTYYRWRDEDPAFSEDCQEILELELDEAEMEINRLRKHNDPSIRLQSCREFLKAKGRERGWGTQKQEISGELNLNHKGVVYVSSPTNSRIPPRT